tara:strand:- start:2545 stop:3603 length:1059 start_codon:yes stop_codon:yes gene_type:complete
MREKVQQQALDSIKLYNYEGIVDVAPRVGKSKIAIDAMKTLKKKVLITAPFNSILDSWQAEFQKWGLEDKPDIINQRSLEKINLKDYDLIISDEIHTLSERQLGVLAGNKVLGFSGSIGSRTKLKLSDTLGINPIYTYSIDQAIKDGIISDYEINIIPCKLDNSIKYVPAGNKVTQFKVTEYNNYVYLTSMFEKFKQLGQGNAKFSFASKRANLIYKSNTKIQACKRLLKSLSRALIFTARTEVADLLGDKAYHSKIKENNLEHFINGDIDKLAVCEMSSMGITIPDLKVGVFHQMRSSEESAIQKVLRMCNWEDGETAQIYIFMYKDTQDEQWVSKAIEPFSKDRINFLTL